MITFLIVVLAGHYYAKQGMPKLAGLMVGAHCAGVLIGAAKDPLLDPVIAVAYTLAFMLMLLGSILIINYRIKTGAGKKRNR